MKGFVKYLVTALKGMGMGAADVIPGVSGGTIAFMTGIYEELIASLNAINLTAVKLFFTGKFKAFWEHINGGFLLSLAIGILISIFSLARLMQFLLANYPAETWAFFFGLIVASSIFILGGIKGWKILDFVFLAAGIALGAIICTLSPASTPDGLWFIFLCGALAICAMILPGISGSFILLILGKYQYIIGAVTDLKIMVLAVFAVGAIIGLLSFSKFLHWLLDRYNRPTVILLAGFIIGSLVKVWPWHDGNALAIPSSGDPHILPAVLCAIAGAAVVTAVEMLGRKRRFV